MRLVSFRTGGTESWGVVVGDGIVACRSVSADVVPLCGWRLLPVCWMRVAISVTTPSPTILWIQCSFVRLFRIPAR
ncbi:hypothetical protein BH10PSE7_BH10PSE7_12510 [soil metagenome]